MKRSSILCQAALVGVLGCSGATTPVAISPDAGADTPQPVTTTHTVDEGGTTVTFVSLKVPNMH